MLSAACCPCSCLFRACCGLAVSRLVPYVPCGVCPSSCWPVTLLDVRSAKRPSQAVPRSDPHVTFFQPGRAHELARRPMANGVVRGRALDQAARGSRRVPDRERGSAGGDRGLLLADVCAHAARALQRWARRVSWLSSCSVPCCAVLLYCSTQPSVSSLSLRGGVVRSSASQRVGACGLRPESETVCCAVYLMMIAWSCANISRFCS